MLFSSLGKNQACKYEAVVLLPKFEIQDEFLGLSCAYVAFAFRTSHSLDRLLWSSAVTFRVVRIQKKCVLCLQCLLGRLSVASGELEFNLLMQRLKSLNFDILNFIILLRIRNLGF